MRGLLARLTHGISRGFSSSLLASYSSPVKRTMSDDEFAALDDLSQYTEEDFKRIDAAIEEAQSNKIEPSAIEGKPLVSIELDSHPTAEPGPSKHGRTDTSSPQQSDNRSPQEIFRKRKTLSVSDLIGPAWCELQFDYGLRQKRSRKLESRPASFRTGTGKEIVVEKAKAAKREVGLTKGKIVHKALEREVRPEEVHVKPTTDEERWALRLIDMLSCLESLMTLGCAREMPVFGIVHGEVTVGIIDELVRKTVPSSTSPGGTKRSSKSMPNTPQKPKRSRTIPSPSQTKMDTFLIPSTPKIYPPLPSEDLATIPRTPHQHTLHIIDTKTRRKDSLPPHEDTEGTRLQLMLYHRLMNSLLSTSPPFDFSGLWDRLDLGPYEPLSEKFLRSASPMLASADYAGVTCLHDLVQLWTNMIPMLDIPGVDTTLQLVYRLQPKASTTKGKQSRKNSLPRKTSTNVLNSIEEQDLAKAVAASLKDIGVTEDQELARVIAESLEDPMLIQNESTDQEQDAGPKDMAHDPEFLLTLQQSLIAQGTDMLGTTDTPNEASRSPSVPDTPATPVEEVNASGEVAKIIGTKEFTFDGDFLDTYLQDTLRWWRGLRPPRGVALQQSGRCFSCEYCDGCEWREEKALEAKETLKQRRLTRKLDTTEQLAIVMPGGPYRPPSRSPSR